MFSRDYTPVTFTGLRFLDPASGLQGCDGGRGGGVGLQDARHLLVQVLQGLEQARQHELVVVLVV